MNHRIGCSMFSSSPFIGLLVVLGFVGFATPQQPKPRGTLCVAWEANISGLYPHLSLGMQTRHVVGNLFNSLVTLDAHTIRFILKHPTRTLLPELAADRVGFLQMSPASYRKWGRDEVTLHPVGTGPFTLARWEQNQVIVLEKNPHSFKPGLPYLHRIELRIMKNGITRMTALRAGEADFANMVPREHVERLERDPRYSLPTTPR